MSGIYKRLGIALTSGEIRVEIPEELVEDNDAMDIVSELATKVIQRNLEVLQKDLTKSLGHLIDNPEVRIFVASEEVENVNLET